VVLPATTTAPTTTTSGAEIRSDASATNADVQISAAATQSTKTSDDTIDRRLPTGSAAATNPG
jgi:hypothetical protein